MSDHDELGPSKLARIIACRGSVALSRGEPDEAGPDARLGSAAHALLADCMIGGNDAADCIGEKYVIDDEVFIVDEEMAGAVQQALDVLREERFTQWWVERRLDIPGLNIFGTADYIGYDPLTKTLRCVDYKHGKGVWVDAAGNPQLFAYAWGAYLWLSVVDEIEHIEIGVIQPRMDNVQFVTYTPAQVQQWARETSAVLAQARGENAPLAAGDHCKFCPAKAKCPAVREMVVDTTGIDFEILDGGDSEADQLAGILPRLDQIEDWLKATRARALALLEAGTPIPGYKLVQGRRGARAWTDSKAAEALLKEKFRLPVDDIYTKEVISPTAAEKLLAKESPRRWAQLTPLVTQSEGRPSVVPVDDKRPALVREPIKFDNLSTEEFA